MTTYICIAAANATTEMHEGADLVQAIQAALVARDITVTATEVLPLGGTRYIRRETDPEDFWAAQMDHAIGDNDEWGYGASVDEAMAMAQPEIDE
ncbi:MAG: hypothetical protein Q4G24_10545 [Paracoccus sp. (in: a-proteobacteria)]|uniref:hypothetical protein n=1 Tax=Paracoccus sp. TaxID=267 RepID=UPI0026E0486E|nr:hypothetical protein [Paracoccus sp. (in: a-proteobacteria)]MDO5621896.1 hypothetical protein [Paracoccus sp. (in: a-proteobacteria)]